MFQGFYNLASGMLTQNRGLNVISNNMTNMSTPGYKRDTLTSTTFQEEMLYRTGSQNKASNQIGSINMVRIPEHTVTDFSKGNYVSTGNRLDFAINGEGFFKVTTEAGDSYTRNGSFYVDEEGYLALKGGGRVQGTGGDIFLDSDQIFTDSSGGLYDQEGELIDNLSVVDFEDYTGMTKSANGLFATTAEEIEAENPNIMNTTLELSNATPAEEMQNMMTTQRSFQSASQMLKIYDGVMTKAVTEIARF